MLGKVGGEPAWFQGDQTPRCDDCGRDMDFVAQLDEGVREGWITAGERVQLEELRAMTLDAIWVDDFDTGELRSAGYATQHAAQGRAAA